MNKTKQIAQAVLAELDQFNDFTVGEFKPPEYNPIGTQQKYEVWKNQKEREKEPFISYVKVREKLEHEEEWKERIYLICRGDLPNGIDSLSGAFVSDRTPIGNIMSADIDEDEVEIFLLKSNRKIKKTLIVQERNNFFPEKNEKWDGVRNLISYKSKEEKLSSLREIFFNINEDLSKNGIDATEKKLDGSKLAQDIEEAELAELKEKESKSLRSCLKTQIGFNRRSIKRIIAI